MTETGEALRLYNNPHAPPSSRRIKTKSVYEPGGGEDGLRILITRFYPRGVRREKYDVWIRSLAPSAELLKRYKNSEIDWGNFKTALLSELRSNIDSIEAIYALNAESLVQDITLLCYEKDGIPCHRRVVRDLIEAPGLLDATFEPKNANYHKTAPMAVHVSDEECVVIP